MNSQQFVKRFEEILTEMIETMKAKNNDYARGSDPFKNLRRHEEYGIVVRLDDKIARLDSFFNPKNSRTLAVKNESIVDTAKDTANYAVLLIMLHEELEAQRDASTFQTVKHREESALVELQERAARVTPVCECSVAVRNIRADGSCGSCGRYRPSDHRVDEAGHPTTSVFLAHQPNAKVCPVCEPGCGHNVGQVAL